MKIFKKVLIFVIAISLIGLFIFIYHYEIFSYEEKFIASFKDESQNSYEVVYIPGNATTQNVIQIRRETKNGDYELIQILEDYTEFSLIERTDSDSLIFSAWVDLSDLPVMREAQKDTFKIYLHEDEVVRSKR